MDLILAGGRWCRLLRVVAASGRPVGERRGGAGCARPAFGLQRPDRVDEVRFVIAASPARSGIGVERVHAALDPPNPPSCDLVSHGVGEGLGRECALDRIAVMV
jgi:hypothetical protein